MQRQIQRTSRTDGSDGSDGSDEEDVILSPTPINTPQHHNHHRKKRKKRKRKKRTPIIGNNLFSSGTESSSSFYSTTDGGGYSDSSSRRRRNGGGRRHKRNTYNDNSGNEQRSRFNRPTVNRRSPNEFNDTLERDYQNDRNYTGDELVERLPIHIRPNTIYSGKIGVGMTSGMASVVGVTSQQKALINKLKRIFVKQSLQYFNQINTPFFKMIRNIAGFTSRSLKDYIADLPESLKQYSTGFNLSFNEKLMFQMHRPLLLNMIDTFNQHTAKVEIENRKNLLKKTQNTTNGNIVQILQLQRQIRGLEDHIKNIKENNNNIEDLEDERELNAELTEDIQENENTIEVLQEQIKKLEKERNPPVSPGDEPSQRFNSQMIQKIGSIIGKHQHKGSHIVFLKKIFDETAFHVEEIEEKANDNFNERIGISIEDHHQRIGQDIEHSVYNFMSEKVMQSNGRVFGFTDYLQNNLSVVLKENITSQIEMALDRISGIKGIMDQNYLTIEDMMQNPAVAIRFAQYVGSRLKLEEFDNTTRNRLTKLYHSDKSRETIKKEQIEHENWFLINLTMERMSVNNRNTTSQRSRRPDNRSQVDIDFNNSQLKDFLYNNHYSHHKTEL